MNQTCDHCPQDVDLYIVEGAAGRPIVCRGHLERYLSRGFAGISRSDGSRIEAHEPTPAKAIKLPAGASLPCLDHRVQQSKPFCSNDLAELPSWTGQVDPLAVLDVADDDDDDNRRRAAELAAVKPLTCFGEVDGE